MLNLGGENDGIGCHTWCSNFWNTVSTGTDGGDDMNKVYILLWYYGDKSAFGVVDVFSKVEQAEAMLDRLKEYGDRQFQLVEKELL